MDIKEQDHKGSYYSSCSGDLNNSARFYFDDDGCSYLDLNVEAPMPESEDFEFQISFESQPNDSDISIADELFKDGQMLAIESLEVDSSSVSGSETRVSHNNGSFPEGLEESPRVRILCRREVAEGELSEPSPGSIGDGLYVDGGRRRYTGNKEDQELGGSRKSSKITAVLLNNKILKFLIKLGSKKVGATFTSVRQTSQRSAEDHPEAELIQGTTHTQRPSDQKHQRGRLKVPFNRWFAPRKNSSRNRSSSSSSNKMSNSQELIGGVEAGRTSGALKRNVDAIRGIVKALSLRPSAAAGGKKKSCPAGSSYQLSPSQGSTVVNYRGTGMERDSSVSSAIAHCKFSFRDNVSDNQ